MRVLRLLLAGYLVLLVYAGLLPLKFRPKPQAMLDELKRSVQYQPFGPLEISAADVWTNVWVFIPAGILAAGAFARWRRRWAIPLVAGLLGAVASGMIETGQLALTGRCCSLTDFSLNVGSTILAALAGMVLFGRDRIERGTQALRNVTGRHGYLAAVALAVGVLAETAWPITSGGFSGPGGWDRVQWSITAGLAEFPWHKWLIRIAAVYGAMTILATGPLRDAARMQARAWRAAVMASLLALLAQGTLLLTPTGQPSAAYVLVACLSSGVAALLAPRLGRRRIELPSAVAAATAGVLALLAYIHWLSEGGSAPYSVWKLYATDSGWQGFRLLRHVSLIASLSFMTALQLSLRVGWSLRRRMLAGVIVGFAAGMIVRVIAKLLWHDASELVNVHALASYVESLVAAGGGALLFGVLWPMLDRRGSRRSGEAQQAYAGPDRRGGNDE